MKPLLTLLSILTLIHISLIGQGELKDYTEKEYHKTAKVYMADQQPFKIKDLTIKGDSLHYTNYLTKRKEIIALSTIETLKVKKGTRIIGGAILGATIPTIFVMEAFLDNKPNADNARLVAAAVIGGGGIPGAAIGYSIPIWETYQFEDANKTAMSIDYKIQLVPNIVGSGLVMKF